MKGMKMLFITLILSSLSFAESGHLKKSTGRPAASGNIPVKEDLSQEDKRGMFFFKPNIEIEKQADTSKLNVYFPDLKEDFSIVMTQIEYKDWGDGKFKSVSVVNYPATIDALIEFGLLSKNAARPQPTGASIIETLKSQGSLTKLLQNPFYTQFHHILMEGHFEIFPATPKLTEKNKSLRYTISSGPHNKDIFSSQQRMDNQMITLSNPFGDDSATAATNKAKGPEPKPEPKKSPAPKKTPSPENE